MLLSNAYSFKLTISTYELSYASSCAQVDWVGEHFLYSSIGCCSYWLVLSNQIISIIIKPGNFWFCFTVGPAILNTNTSHKNHFFVHIKHPEQRTLPLLFTRSHKHNYGREHKYKFSFHEYSPSGYFNSNTTSTFKLMDEFIFSNSTI